MVGLSIAIAHVRSADTGVDGEPAVAGVMPARRAGAAAPAAPPTAAAGAAPAGTLNEAMPPFPASTWTPTVTGCALAGS
jgi:hypothetical protein